MPEARQQRDDGIVPLSFETFAGVNTATQRTGVPDQQAFWLDGFMPLAQRRLRTLPGTGAALYTAAVPGNVVAFYFYNIGATPYVAVFQADGSLIQVNTSTGVTTTILTAGSIINPTIPQMGTSQYGQQYLLTVANQMNGYWVWDGTAVYTAGTIAPGVILTNSGAGYATPPIVSAQGGHGHGAMFIAQVANGIVTNVVVQNSGTGYQVGDSVSLVFTGGTQVGSGGTVAVASMASVAGGSGGTVIALWSVVAGLANSFNGPNEFVPSPSIANVGSGYSSLVSASFGALNAGAIGWVGGSAPAVAPTEVSGTLNAVSIIPAGQILSLNTYRLVKASAAAVGTSVVTVNNSGLGFAAGAFAFDGSNTTAIPVGTSMLTSLSGGVNAITLSAAIASPGIFNNDILTVASPTVFPSISVSDSGFFYVASVTITAPGAGYGPNAQISVSGGGAPVAGNAVLSPSLSGVLTGSIVGVFIQSGGLYGTSVAPTLTVTDSATAAAGTIGLMPFGVKGTAVQTYAGHVWVFNGNVFQFSAPGSVSNFATSAGGGSQQSNASYLKVGYTGAVSANGFLFLIGDSSMDYISGVVTSGSVATTTFTQNNSDPDIGTPYAAAITTLGSEIFIANATGIFVSAGGTFQKISEMLDGVYNTVPATQFNTNPFNGFQLSVAKATIFGKRTWMALVPIIDPVSGLQVNKLLMVRDKKIWWASQQDVGLTFIQGQEINSIFTAYGTDGTHIYPLFNQPSAGFTKVAQSRLWDEPGGIDFTKATSRFWSTWFCNSAVSTSITLTIDALGIDGSGNQYANSSSYPIAGPTATGYYVSTPQAVGQQGIFAGMTLTTNAPDLELITAKIAEEIVAERS